MGCIETISYDKFPKQAESDHPFMFGAGARVKVCYHYDTTHCHCGTIVRDDTEEPFETIIKLDNGRYIRGAECQYSILKESNITNADYIRNMSDEELYNLIEKAKMCGGLIRAEESSKECHNCKDGFCCNVKKWLQAERNIKC